MLVEGIVAYLSADAGLQAILGTAASRSDKTTGIFPVIAPDQVPMPYIVFQQISGDPIAESFAGTGNLLESRIRFTCYGTTYKNAKALAKTLKRVLFSISGKLSGSAEVGGAWLKLEADDVETQARATIYAVHIDFEFNWSDNDNT